MIVFVVGPTGVGKTTICDSAGSTFPNVVFDQLDRLAAEWAFRNHLIDSKCVQRLRSTLSHDDSFLSAGLLAIGELEGRNPGRHLVIDVGAGFQVAKAARALHRIFPVISLYADPESAYKRILHHRTNESRSIEQFTNDEFNHERSAVYDSAQHQIDTSSQTLEETLQKFVEILTGIIESWPIPPRRADERGPVP